MYRYRLSLRRYRRQLRTMGVVLLVILIIGAAIVWLSHRPKPKITDFNSCILAGYDASNSDPQTCTDGHHTYVAPSSSTASTSPSTPAETVQQYNVLVQGDTKGSYPARQQVVTTQAAWSALWGQLYDKVVPEPPLLPVDFSQNEVIVLTDGPKPSGGYALDVTGVAASSAGGTIDYEAYAPQGSCTASLSPSDAVVAVVTAKITGPMTYSVTPVTRKC